MPRVDEKAISRIELMILGLLSEKPMHGYEISRTLGLDEMRLWVDISMPSVYASLAKLRKRGLVHETLEKESGKPERSVFHITNKGREAFLDALFIALGSLEVQHIDYNIPIFLMNRLPSNRVLEALNRKREFMKNWIASIEHALSKVTEKGSSAPTLPAVLGHMKLVVEARLRWLDESIRSLTSKGEISETEITALPLPKSALMTLQGSLRDTALADIIHLTGLGKRTGRLTLQKDHLVRSIFFRDGEVVTATSFSMGRKTRTTQDTDQQSRQKSVLRDILQTFTWSDGQFVFQEEVGGEGMVPLDIANENLILAGCSLVEDSVKISKIIPSTEVIFDRVEDIEDVVKNLHFSNDNKKVFMLVNGVRDVQTIAHMASLSIFKTGRVLYTLVSVGILAAVSRDKAELLRLFKYITHALFDRMKALRVKESGKIAEEFNSFAERESLPFRVEEGTLSEKVESGLTLEKLIEQGKVGSKALIDDTAKHLGKSFAEQAVQSIIDYLPSDLYESFSKYGFADIITR